MAAWAEAQQAVRERIRFYDERVARASSGCATSSTPARSTTRSGGRRSCTTSACSSTTSGRSSRRRSSTRSSRGCSRRTYVHNDFIFVRAAVSTEYIESDPPTYRSYYPDERGPPRDAARGVRRLRLEPPVRRPRARRRVRLARAASSTSTASWPRPSRTPAAGARLGVLPQQGRVRDREGRQRRRARPPFVVPVLHDADGRLVLDTVLLDEEAIAVLFSLSRAYFMVDMDVPSGYVQFLQSLMPSEAALGALHGGRAREAGQDAVLPRPAPPPAPLAGRLRRGARHAAAW